jgi:hypothetical protein
LESHAARPRWIAMTAPSKSMPDRFKTDPRFRRGGQREPGPYSRNLRRGLPGSAGDGRSATARYLRDLQAQLFAHCGGSLRRGRPRKNGPRQPNGRLRQIAIVIAPTAERFRRGPLELIQDAVADVAGNASGLYRAIDILETLERVGAITDTMRFVGERLRRLFRVGRLNRLHARDVAVPHQPLSASSRAFMRSHTAEAAAAEVWAAIESVGGIGSVHGSALWHLLGEEQDPAAWEAQESARRGYRVDAETELAAALAKLAEFYATRR